MILFSLLFKIVDSHAVLRKTTKQSLAQFAQIPPTVTFCKTIVWYHNQDIDIDIDTTVLFRFPIIHVLICVCVLSPKQFYHLCTFWHS